MFSDSTHRKKETTDIKRIIFWKTSIIDEKVVAKSRLKLKYTVLFSQNPWTALQKQEASTPLSVPLNRCSFRQVKRSRVSPGFVAPPVTAVTARPPSAARSVPAKADTNGSWVTFR